MGDTESELATSPSVTTQCFYGGNDITMAINSSTMKDVLDNTVTELLGMANQWPVQLETCDMSEKLSLTLSGNQEPEAV